MGSAILSRWLDMGLDPQAVHVVDPAPSDWLKGTGAHLNGPIPHAPSLALIAVKPQLMEATLPTLAGTAISSLFVSVAAGVQLAAYEKALGKARPIIRAMPNTPAAIGQGVTALIGNARVTGAHMDLAEILLGAVGDTVRLQSEAQMDAVTGLSGSGPAYVFYLIECLARAGEAEGLSPELALQLAQATVAGAGALANANDTAPARLRENVTSPNGTTEAGLQVLMDSQKGLDPLVRATVAAAAQRSRQLSS